MRFLWMFTLLCLPLAGAPDPFALGVQKFNQGEFEAARICFQNTDATSPALEYNLGNTLMRLDRPAEAVVHYRRAQWLRPGDPDLKANLKQAVSLTGAPIPELPLTRKLTGWWSPGSWQNALLAGCWIFAGLGLAGQFAPRLRPARIWMLPPAGLLLLLAAGGTWASSPSRFRDEAVVVDEHEVTARFEPLPDATEHFSMPGGSVIRITSQSRDWVRIESDGKTGWVRENSVRRLIHPGAS